jgi:hypothetical protein
LSRKRFFEPIVKALIDSGPNEGSSIDEKKPPDL